jgi:hypothetical protein
MTVDRRVLADLVEFARIEQQSHDCEPWAELISELRRMGELTREQSLWVLWLYNAYDNFGSAWAAYEAFPSPQSWSVAEPHHQRWVATLAIERERRNLLGGRMIKRWQSYVDLLGGDSQMGWLSRAVSDEGTLPPTPQGVRERNWDRMLAHTRKVWGVGRQASFEWTEFLTKVDPGFGLAMDAGDACLWESSGPRKCLQRIYGLESPSKARLEAVAGLARSHLKSEGVDLAWVDFETIICDFNVMRDGRYYPGKHLAALREEVQDVPILMAAYRHIIPEPWRSGIRPGVDKQLNQVYLKTGRIITP